MNKFSWYLRNIKNIEDAKDKYMIDFTEQYHEYNQLIYNTAFQHLKNNEKFDIENQKEMQEFRKLLYEYRDIVFKCGRRVNKVCACIEKMKIYQVRYIVLGSIFAVLGAGISFYRLPWYVSTVFLFLSGVSILLFCVQYRRYKKEILEIDEMCVRLEKDFRYVYMVKANEVNNYISVHMEQWNMNV